MKTILKKHPGIDFFIGFFGGPPIPTKQDKFKPLPSSEVIIEENSKQRPIRGYDVYLKKKDTNSIKEFETKFKQFIKEELTEEHPYPADVKIEMIICILMNKKRINEVDIDNLSKSIIDCFNGLVFSDDNQIISLYVSKKEHSLSPSNGLMVGIRKLKDEKDSWFSGIKLGYFDNKE